MTKEPALKGTKRKGGTETAGEQGSFEEALAGLERSVETLKNEGTTLAGIVKSFEEGMAFYERCETILREAKQKIEVCDKDAF
jgi:exodeoxyribonuclease VII small subunit